MFFSAFPTKIGSVRFIALGSGVVMECGTPNITMVYAEDTGLFEMNGMEFRNCFCGDSNGPIGITNVTTLRFSNLYVHNNYALYGGGFSYAQNIDNLIIDNCTFSNNEGKRTHLLF